MIDFEEELKRYEPNTEVREAEDAIYNRDLTDLVDVMQDLMNTASAQTITYQ